MYTESNLKERCQRILEENGGCIADKASRILLEEPMLKDLQAPLEFISENWRDPLTPSLMALSCEAVGGRAEITHEPALAMNLINLSFYIWDDIIDKTSVKRFKPTLVGKFGEGTALMIGGLASAKAFSILNRMEINGAKRQNISNMFWNLWTEMAKAETVNLSIRKKGSTNPQEKLLVIETEAAADLGTSLKIGALLGNGSANELRHLSKYGQYLGVVLEVWKDFLVSINLTLELAEKMRSRAMPYSLLWAMRRSEKIRRKLEDIKNKNKIEPTHIKEIVELTLEIKTLDNTMKTLRKFTNKAVKELLKLKSNNATQTLRIFVEAQPQLFYDSLSFH